MVIFYFSLERGSAEAKKFMEWLIAVIVPLLPASVPIYCLLISIRDQCCCWKSLSTRITTCVAVPSKFSPLAKEFHRLWNSTLLDNQLIWWVTSALMSTSLRYWHPNNVRHIKGAIFDRSFVQESMKITLPRPPQAWLQAYLLLPMELKFTHTVLQNCHIKKSHHRQST